jgi:hypothetical protein
LKYEKKGALAVYHSILVGQCPTKMALEVRKNVWRKENRAVASGKKGKGESITQSWWDDVPPRWRLK